MATVLPWLFLFCFVEAKSDADTVVPSANVASLHTDNPSGDQSDSGPRVPAGHLKPLGSHRQAEGFIESVAGFPHPEEFYNKYVAASKPVLFKGAAKDLPAYKLWTDAYIVEHYGAQVVEIEMGKKENRSADVKVMTMSDFVRLYKEKDVYMVVDILQEMMDDLVLPRPLRCGGFQSSLAIGVVWFSSGGTKSVFHSDDVDNINCILDGSKSLVMIDKVYKPQVEAAHFVANKSYSLMDVDKVDMHKFPLLQEVRWWEARMEKGDCLFIPIRWYHTVDSSRTRNLAVNLWFSHLLWFNQSDCKGCCDGSSPPLSKYKLENSEEQLREEIFSLFEGYKKIELKDAIREFEGILEPAEVQEIFQMADLNKDLVLSWEEVYKLDITELVRHFPELAGSEDGTFSPEHDEL